MLTETLDASQKSKPINVQCASMLMSDSSLHNRKQGPQTVLMKPLQQLKTRLIYYRSATNLELGKYSTQTQVCKRDNWVVMCCLCNGAGLNKVKALSRWILHHKKACDLNKDLSISHSLISDPGTMQELLKVARIECQTLHKQAVKTHFVILE